MFYSYLFLKIYVVGAESQIEISSVSILDSSFNMSTIRRWKDTRAQAWSLRKASTVLNNLGYVTTKSDEIIKKEEVSLDKEQGDHGLASDDKQVGVERARCQTRRATSEMSRKRGVLALAG